MSHKSYKIKLDKTGNAFTVKPGLSIKEALELNGIAFPNNCNGQGKCLSCRVRFLSDPPEMTELEEKLLDPKSDFRMACQHLIENDIHIKLPLDNTMTDLKSLSDFQIMPGGKGFGIAIDLGTTTVALYIADLNTGRIIAQRFFMNPQVMYGGDVMTRIAFARQENNNILLRDCIRDRIGREINALVSHLNIERVEICKVILAGNSAMSQIWLGHGGKGLERIPFKSILERIGVIKFDPLMVELESNCDCLVLPVLSGFIGGDITAAILASNFDPERITLLIDLGTNGELVLSKHGELYATSAAAGPAFEGVGMSSGMPAIQGAVERCESGLKGEIKPQIIGDQKPMGFCGSGYISAIATLLKRGIINNTGLIRLNALNERRWSINQDPSLPPFITQEDIRKFQLAKGAIAAASEILMEDSGISPGDLDEVILTGSFGNRIDPQAAIDVGLIPDLSVNRIRFIDNAAGRGAAKCLGDESLLNKARELQDKCRVINLGDSEVFQDRFVENMSFRRF